MKSLFNVLFGCACVVLVGCSDNDVATEKVFDGSSAELEGTVVVSTLDTPMVAGKNVIWCSSFQLAWNELKDDVVKDSVRLAEADGDMVAERLNKAKQSKGDLDAGDYYAKAGYVADGIVETIKKEMAAKFPSYSTSHLQVEDGEEIWAYGYLNVKAKFDEPFLERGFEFTGADGKVTKVQGFGACEGYPCSQQIEILYSKNFEPEEGDEYELKEFIIDPCKTTEPYQIVLACVEPNVSLAETIAGIETKINDFKTAELEEWEKEFGDFDELYVPVTSWKVEHEFKELIGKDMKNKGFDGLYISKAMQDITFCLDRNGVVLESESLVAAECVPRLFYFDRPFLIYLKKRDGGEPFFAMWVDNAELLNKR